MAKDWTLHALHILDCIGKIKIIIEHGDIAQDFILYDAVLRNLQTLSESAIKLPEDFKTDYPNINLKSINMKSINSFRNILVHNYLGEIDPETVQKIIEAYLPELDNAVKAMLGI